MHQKVASSIPSQGTYFSITRMSLSLPPSFTLPIPLPSSVPPFLPPSLPLFLTTKTFPWARNLKKERKIRKQFKN